MEKYLSDLIIFLLQLVVFYILPFFAEPTDSMGLIVLIVIFTFVLSIVEGIISNNNVKKIYPLYISIVFIPTIYIHYNDSAYIYVLWFLIESVVGLFIGSIIRRLIWKKK